MPRLRASSLPGSLASFAIRFLKLFRPFSLGALALHRTLGARRARFTPELVAPILDVLVRALVADGVSRDLLKLVKRCAISPRSLARTEDLHDTWEAKLVELHTASE